MVNTSRQAAAVDGFEIEVTPEMIEAGGKFYYRDFGSDWEEAVKCIYLEMEMARRRASRPSPSSWSPR